MKNQTKKKEKKTAWLQIRVSEQERDRYKDQANKEGLGFSSWALRILEKAMPKE